MLSISEWLHHIPGLERLRQLPWHRVGSLYIGEKLALGVLAFVTLTEVVVAANRFMAMEFAFPVARKTVRSPKRKKVSRAPRQGSTHQCRLNCDTPPLRDVLRHCNRGFIVAL